MLQQERWAKRCPLDDMLFEDAWGQAVAPPALR
jgi:5,6-dimethylbenzimidazole synthase